MPTYTWACQRCGNRSECVMSISRYLHARPEFVCCGEPMPRTIEVAPGLAMHNALASERHYAGLRATDGTPIDTRAKHRAYMRERGLTTIDDFRETWKRDAAARAARLQGEDPSRRADIAEAIKRLEANPATR